MGLIGKWKNYKENQLSKRITRNLKVINNSKAIKEDRVAAIEFFKDINDISTAAPAFLARFEYSLEHGINDTREKESSLEGLIGLGPDALPIINEHLKNTNKIAWPIKALVKLGNEEQAVDALKGCLNFDDISFDQAKLDKNYDILCYLVDYQIGDFVDKIGHFLKEHDERIRFVAAELLLEQDNPKIVPMLEHYLIDESAENTRLRQAVSEKFATKSWKIEDINKIQEASLMPGYALDSSGVVKKA